MIYIEPSLAIQLLWVPPHPACPLPLLALTRDLEPQELPGGTTGSVHTVDPPLTPLWHTGLIGRRRITHPIGVPIG